MEKSEKTGEAEGEKNLTQKVYNRLREMMLNYEIVPGQRLIFVDLAKQLGVSRTPVNNALAILAKEGFLDFVPNQGYSVHKITEAEAESLYSILKIFSLGSLSAALRKLDAQRLAELEQRKAAYERAVAEQVNRRRFLLDQEFHAYLVQMSENLYLADYFRDVYQRIYLRHRIESLRPERAEQVVREHQEIFEAVRLRNVQLAKDLTAAHIEAGKAYIFSHIFAVPA